MTASWRPTRRRASRPRFADGPDARENGVMGETGSQARAVPPCERLYLFRPGRRVGGGGGHRSFEPGVAVVRPAPTRSATCNQGVSGTGSGRPERFPGAGTSPGLFDSRRAPVHWCARGRIEQCGTGPWRTTCRAGEGGERARRRSAVHDRMAVLCGRGRGARGGAEPGGRMAATLPRHMGRGLSVALRPEDRTEAGEDGDHRVRLWSPR